MTTSHGPLDRSLDVPRRCSARWVLVALAIGLLTACGNPGDHPSSGASTDTEAPDVDLDLAGGEPDAPGPSDASPLDLLDIGAGAACPGGSGCPCKENPDCQTGLCIDDPAVAGGKACAATCSGNCATGYACANVSGSGGDIQSICVPKFLHLCEPCAVSKDCEALGLKDSACIDQGELGRFCGVVCSSANDCPADYACQEVPSAEGEKLKQCARKPDGLKPFGACACSEFAVQKKLATACFVESKDASGQVVAKCAGQRTCTAAGLSACAAPEAKAEVCNGEDDDCDGQTDEASCDDGKPCSQDTCDGKNGCQHKPLDGQSCDADGSVCTDGDACKEGVCVAGSKKDCDDKNPCNQDSCDMAKGCTHTDDDGKPCDADGSACTAGDVCQGGQCVKGVAVSCDDGNPCTVDKCDGKTGQCGITNEDDGIPCDDGTKCTSKDACSGGTCKGKAVSCDDDNPCTDDVCDKASGCSPAPLTGSPCNDGNPCTVGDACKDGACDKGKPKVCDFSDTCKPAACDVVDGQCKFKNAKNGSACDDGSACTDQDACLDGTCDGAVLDCNDNNPCTTDSCDAKVGCASGLNTSPCSDGNACTQLDKCAGGKCAGQSVDVKVDCDDGNGCTTDSCDPKQGCLHAANQSPCDDGNPCSASDQCGDKVCKPGSSTCACQNDADCAKQDDADLCNGLMFCDKAVSGQFACKTKPGSVIACDISLNTACSQQVCDSSSGKCGAKSAVDGKTCDADSSVCSEGDACAAGTCLPGGKVDCDDKNPCTVDSCDPKLGCVHAANSSPCDADGNACTLNDACKDKVCMPGPKKSCDDGEFCTDDGCAKVSGECLFAGLPKDGTACDADASVCTLGDACSGGKCLSGKAKACDDGNPCTDDSCDAKQGCAYTPNQTPCDDGNACTKNDLCAASQCAGKSLNPPVDCDDGQVCTSDGCDPKVGCTHAANQQPCDDGNPCTLGDLCSAKACQPGSNQCGCEKDADCASQEDGDLCNGTLFCDTAKLPYQCKVKATTIVQCDASKDTICAANVCTPATGKCGLVSAADGKDCDFDGSVCTSADACAGGVCKAGSKVDCGDPNPCTTDTCDAKAGCQHVANTAPCDADGNACTLNDACQDKVCIADAKKVCDDGKACTVDSCDKTSGKCVVDAAVQEGKSCDADGSVCTVGDACAQGACVAGTNKACDDSKVCTDDSCDDKMGCVNIANVATCTDGDACTDKDVCSGGSCVGTGVSCNDGNPCTDDSCDKAKGCVQLPNSVTCSDGNACTASDTCGSGKCAGAPVTCDDKDPCTADSCDAGKGCLAAALQEKADCSADGKNWCMAGKCVAKAYCGDGLVNQASEECDDGNMAGGDGCSATCQQENDCTGATFSAGSYASATPFVSAWPDNWTVEGWMSLTGTFGNGGWGGIVGTPAVEQGCANNWYLATAPNGAVNLGAYNGKNAASSAGVWKAGVPFHYAVVYTATTQSLVAYIDGKQVANLSGIGKDFCTKRVDLQTTIGSVNNWLAGTSQSLRYSGKARYTADFTPAQKLTVDADTKWQFDFAEGSGSVAKSQDGAMSFAFSGPVKWAQTCKPVCTANQSSCLGNLAGTCNAQGTGLTSATDCGAGGKVCSAGTCISPDCGSGYVLIATNNGSVCAPDVPTWGIAALSPTTLTDNGDGTASDSLTQLMWQKSASATAMNWADAKTWCQNQGTGGQWDWRLPTIAELSSIVDFAKQNPAIADVFAATPSEWFWTAVPFQGIAADVWGVRFTYGNYYFAAATNSQRVRCVRGLPGLAKIPGPRFVVDAATGTVYDSMTKRTWQRAVDPNAYSPSGAKSYCSGLTLAGGGWHLPDVRELQSIVDRQQFKPAIDATAFPDTPNAYFWTSTPWIAGGQSWFVYFHDGYSDHDSTSASYRARCIR